MAERIKKTPIRKALEAMDIVWENANNKLHNMGPQEVMDRMPGAVYYNSTHPFRDKLHIEGFQEGLRYALTGHSDAVESWLQEAENIQQNPDTYKVEREQLPGPSRFQVLIASAQSGASLTDLFGIAKALYFQRLNPRR